MLHRPHPTRVTWRRAALAGLAGLALTLTACSSASSSSSSGGGGDSSAEVTAAKDFLAKYSGEVSEYPEVQAIDGGVDTLKGKNIWYVPIGSAVPILNAFGVGVEQAMSAVGADTHVCDGKFLPTTIASCLNQAASQGADGVITGYIDYQLVPTAFDNLVSKKIPVLIAGEQPSGGKTDSSALAFYDTSESINILQRLAADAIIADSGGKAKVLFIGVTDSPQTKGAATYAKQYFADSCADCSFTEIDYNTASLNKVPSQVSSALIANPDTTYVFPSLDAGAPGAITGIKTAGFARKVKLASTNGALDSLQRVEAGDIQFCDIGFSPIYSGWQFADGLMRMMTGGTPVSAVGVIRAFTKDNVGGLDLTPDAYETNAWYGSDDFQKTFMSAWGAV